MLTKILPYLRSFSYSPGATNAQNWYSHTGAISTAPAAIPTFSRSMNTSNGWVCSSRHSPSPLKSASMESGSAQYGPRIIYPGDGIGPIAGLNQMEQDVPTATEA